MDEQNGIITTHKLDFLVGEWRTPDWLRFKVGSCGGLWWSLPDCYLILSIINDIPGNGHLQDVFEWFEFSCQRDQKNLVIMEVWNEGFKRHLLDKRGFIVLGEDNIIKVFNKFSYKKLLRKGNEYLKAYKR